MTSPFELFERHARLAPDALALAGSAVRVSRHDLLTSAVQVAARMRLLGVKPGDVVALALPPRLEAVFALATFHEAAISCTAPASIDVPRQLGFDWLFATAALARPNGAETVVTVDGEWLAAASAATSTTEAREYPDDETVCRLVFSSGTTGVPKAVPFTLTNATYRTASAGEHWMQPRPFMSLLGISTVSGFQTYFDAVTQGHTYIVPGRPSENLALMQEFEIASIKASPIQLEALANAMAENPTYLPRLERIQSAGSFLPALLAQRLRRVFACEVVNLYGSSESGTVAVRRGEASDPQDVGVVVHDMEVQVVDDEGKQVPPDAVGTIRYRRPHQAAGYFRDPEASAQHFKDGWFYPGDRASLSARGALRIHGRASEVLNASGSKVDPIVLEAVALGYEGIRDVAVFMAASRDGVERVALAFVSDEEPDVNALAAQLRERFGNVTPTVYFRVAEIPRNDMGKVLRTELAKEFTRLTT